VARDAERTQSIIDQAEEHYKLALSALKDLNAALARAEFDKSVDAVLDSGVDVRANPKLQTYYLQLLERIYRMERPQQGTAPLLKDQRFEPRASDVPVIPPACTADDATRVALRGLRLGMTLAQVRAALPALMPPPADKYGRSNVSLMLYKLPKPPAGFDGVRAMFFDFLDGCVTNISAFYDHSVNWLNAGQFASTLSEQFKLPDDWQDYRPDDSPAAGVVKVLSCGEIQILAGLVTVEGRVAPTITVNDTHAERTLIQRARDEAERLRKLDEQRRKAFKP
jgi:hypothetical protein